MKTNYKSRAPVRGVANESKNGAAHKSPLSGAAAGNLASDASSSGDSSALIPGERLDVAKLKEMSLGALAEAINSRLPEINSAISSARAHAETALKAAISTGHYLIEVKQREKGLWITWVKENCPDLSRATAYRYFGLAKKISHVRPGEDVMTLRQAYIATGILPDAAAVKKKTPNLDDAPALTPADLVIQVKSFRQHMQGLQGLPFDTMDPVVLDQLSKEMSELITVCEQVLAKAAASGAMKQAKVRELPPARNSAKREVPNESGLTDSVVRRHR